MLKQWNTLRIIGETCLVRSLKVRKSLDYAAKYNTQWPCTG